MRTVVVITLIALLVLGSAGAAAAEAAAGPAIEGRIKAYVEARHAAERRDPQLRRTLQSPSTAMSAEDKGRLGRALEGSPMQVDEFVQWHHRVHADAALREQVQKALAAQGAPAGTSGAATGLGAAPGAVPGAADAGSPAPTGAGGPTPTGAGGPAPTGAGGPPPVGAGGPPPK